MEGKQLTYNPKVIFIEDENERDQCQFIYSDKKRCQHDGIYRIGLTIFLCGIHTPGVGRHHKVKPAKDHKKTVVEKLLDLLVTNIGNITTYDEINDQIPELFPRQYISVAISNLRKNHHIENVQFVGYKYLGKINE